MWLAYLALIINLVIIWFMPKRLSHSEIYVTWFVIAAINLASDILLAIKFDLYELDGEGIQLGVHIIEWTLGASYGIIYLNFMPRGKLLYGLYVLIWLAYSLALEALLIQSKFIIYSGWMIWWSAPYYVLALLFLRWHIHFIRSARHPS